MRKCEAGCLIEDHDGNMVCYRDCERCPSKCSEFTPKQEGLFPPKKPRRPLPNPGTPTPELRISRPLRTYRQGPQDDRRATNGVRLIANRRPDTVAPYIASWPPYASNFQIRKFYLPIVP